MDGLTVTCRTCGVKTSFEDAESHVCRARPLQKYGQRPYGDGYEGAGSRRSDDSQRRPFPSTRSESSMSSSFRLSELANF